MTWQQPFRMHFGLISAEQRDPSYSSSRQLSHAARTQGGYNYQVSGRLVKNTQRLSPLNLWKIIKAFGEDWTATVISNNPSAGIFLWKESMNSVNWFASINWWEEEMAGNVGHQAVTIMHLFAFLLWIKYLWHYRYIMSIALPSGVKR